MGMHIVIPVSILVTTVRVGEGIDRIDTPVEILGLTRREILQELRDRAPSRLAGVLAALRLPILDCTFDVGVERESDLRRVAIQSRLE